jgi:hypothetical protein
LLSLLGLSLLSATVSVSIDTIDRMTMSEARHLAQILGEAITRRTGAAVELSAAGEGGCDAEPCRTEPKTEGSQVVLRLDLMSGLTKVRMVIRRGVDRAAVDLMREQPELWPKLIEEAIGALALPRLADSSPPPPPRSWLVPWVALGTGGALLATGGAFGLEVLSAQSSIQTGDKSSPEIKGLVDRARSDALVANTLFACAAGAIAISIVSGVLGI